MKFLMICLFLSVMVMVVLCATLPATKPIEDGEYPLINRVPRSPKHGGIILKLEKDGSLTSINVEGKQTLYEGKYGRVDFGGAIVKTPNEETKGRLTLEAKFEWD